MPNPHEPELKWRCRRGMGELDLLLQDYLQLRYPQAPVAEREAFAALLELQDPLLFAYLLGREQPADQATAGVVAEIVRASSDRRTGGSLC